MRNFFSTLSVRFATAFFWAIFFFTACQFLISRYFSEEWFDHYEQVANWDVAYNIAERIQPLTNKELETEKIGQVLYEMLIPPRHFEFYLLDAKGHILLHFLFPDPIGETAVSVDSIDKAISLKALDRFAATRDSLGLVRAIRALNPRTGEQSVFSAAPITIEGNPGYVYVVLGGQLGPISRAVFRDFSFTLNFFNVSLLITMLLTAAIGLLLSRLLTARLQKLTVAVRAFAEGNYDHPVAIRGNDDIGFLGRTIENMAVTIKDNIATIEQKDAMRRELVAVISHDLRSPLAAMRGVAELLLSNDATLDKDKRERLLAGNLHNVEKLSTLVDDLFELAKLDAGESELILEEIDCRVIFELVSDHYAAETQQTGSSIVIKIEEAVSVRGDLRLLERALGNLIGNALKYGGGNLEVVLFAQATSEHVIIEVRDNGKGIPTEDLPFLFQQFYRGAGRQQAEGSGLGLAIVQRIIERHGGSIQVASKQGVGTTFTIQLPRFTQDE